MRDLQIWTRKVCFVLVWLVNQWITLLYFIDSSGSQPLMKRAPLTITSNTCGPLLEKNRLPNTLYQDLPQLKGDEQQKKNYVLRVFWA